MNDRVFIPWESGTSGGIAIMKRIFQIVYLSHTPEIWVIINNPVSPSVAD
jgi:hypothetical protein